MLMDVKICFKCNEEKPLSNYYKHAQMSDGHLNKCKSCTKSDTKANLLEKSKDPLWVEKEKNRGREKYHRLEYKGKYNPTYEDKKKAIDKYKEKFPEKWKAKNYTTNIPCNNGHLHHWSYNKEHYKDVFDITEQDHNKIHRFLIYDQERLMYRRVDTMELLDSRENHENYIEFVIRTKY